MHNIQKADIPDSVLGAQPVKRAMNLCSFCGSVVHHLAKHQATEKCRKLRQQQQQNPRASSSGPSMPRASSSGPSMPRASSLGPLGVGASSSGPPRAPAAAPAPVPAPRPAPPAPPTPRRAPETIRGGMSAASQARLGTPPSPYSAPSGRNVPGERNFWKVCLFGFLFCRKRNKISKM